MIDLSKINVSSLNRSLARASHLDFIKYCWPYESPYLVGRHTRKTCNKIDEAFRRYKNGLSTFIIVTMPPRHGKSEIVSVNLPPHFLGEFPEEEVLVVSHSAKLVYKFSRQSRQIVQSAAYNQLYPHVTLSKTSSSVETWDISNGIGRAQYAGILSGIAGLGGSLIILDDFFKNREDADSEVTSQKVWDEITDNVLLRMPNRVIFVILATRWNTYDPIGRIIEKIGTENFPEFEIIHFPAMSDEYETGTLFPERFDINYYLGKKSFMTDYAWMSLMQNEPIRRGGNKFKTDNIKIVDELPRGLLFKRAWDLASSEKQLKKEDPDWTVGVKGSMVYKKNEYNTEIPVIYVDDVIRMREEAPKRDKKIRDTAIAERITVGVEAFGAYKDAYTSLKELLTGVCMVKKLNPPGDKLVKMDPLESIIESGNLILKKGSWNDKFIEVLSQIPSGKHDDDGDALACLYYMFKRQSAATGHRIGF